MKNEPATDHFHDHEMAGQGFGAHSQENVQRQMAKLAYQAQVYQQQQQLLQQQLAMLDNGVRELNLTLASLESLDKAKGPSYFTIGSGAFVKAEKFDSRKVLVNVGAGVFVEKECEQAIVLVKKRIDNARSAVQRLSAEFESLGNRLRELEQKAQQLQYTGSTGM